MNNSILVVVMAIALTLTACDKTPVVVNVPAETIVVPGPVGPAGKAGEQGVDGNKGNAGDTGDQGNDGAQGETGQAGETGQSGDNTTVIITPPPAESAPTN